MSKVKALVISGYGINCEKEMASACYQAGADVSIVHAKKFLTGNIPWNDCQLLLFPGGFSFGDELGAAKALANRLTYHITNIRQRLLEFVHQGNCILGICNGFQLLVKLGLLPGCKPNQTVSLTHNDSGRFECRWVHHKVLNSPCIFTEGMEQVYLPIRHGEGKLLANEASVVKQMFNDQHVVFQYADESGISSSAFPDNPNGSVEAIGGICDPTGRILGMMAHPEAAVQLTNHPQWTRIKERLLRENKQIPKAGCGLKIFENAVNYLGKK